MNNVRKMFMNSTTEVRQLQLVLVRGSAGSDRSRHTRPLHRPVLHEAEQGPMI
jgi:hypothetical protein